MFNFFQLKIADRLELFIKSQITKRIFTLIKLEFSIYLGAAELFGTILDFDEMFYLGSIDKK